MSDTTRDQQDVTEKAWRVLHLQADEVLRLSQEQVSVWKFAIGGAVCGAALFVAAFAFARLFLIR
jgi:hypothetical protein